MVMVQWTDISKMAGNYVKSQFLVRRFAHRIHINLQMAAYFVV